MVERRRAGDFAARVRVDWNRGYQHACGRGADPLEALAQTFELLAAELPSFRQAG